MLNVAGGGTLWPDISDGGFETAAHTGGTRDTDDVYHPVTMSGVEFEVTSHHHEGVRDLGEGLEVISHAEDGMVEALRHRELPWLGVQWHPERTAVGAPPVLSRIRGSAAVVPAANGLRGGRRRGSRC